MEGQCELRRLLDGEKLWAGSGEPRGNGLQGNAIMSLILVRFRLMMANYENYRPMTRQVLPFREVTSRAEIISLPEELVLATA